MQDAVTTLWRLQKHRKRQARLDLLEAQKAHDGAEERVRDLDEALAESRDLDEEHDALHLAQQHSWRLHLN